MPQFLLRPLKAFGKVTDEEVDQLHALPAVRVSRVLAYIVAVSFEGDAATLKSLLAETAWDPVHVGERRMYRLQSDRGALPGQTDARRVGWDLQDVLMAFAVERSLPTQAHLHRYLDAFPHFRQEIIEFAVSLVEDHLHPDPDDTGPTY